MYDLSSGKREEHWTEGDSAALDPIVVQCYAETHGGKNLKDSIGLANPYFAAMDYICFRC